MIEEQEHHIIDELTGIITRWKITQEIDENRKVIREISREAVGILEIEDNLWLSKKIKDLEAKNIDLENRIKILEGI